MSRTLLVSSLVIVAIIAAIAWAMIPTQSLTVTSQAEHRYTIDEPMPRIRKILVRTNAVKKIVAMADAELLDQKWLDLSLDGERPILNRDWHVEGNGQLEVLTKNAYLGEHKMTLNQAVDITRERLEAINELEKPSGPIRDYRSSLTLSEDASGNAVVDTTLTLTIETKASWLTRSTVKREIQNSADEALRGQEAAIREVVSEHQDELLILPDRS